jgi:uncharacterized protein YecA (UPF0149 family)
MDAEQKFDRLTKLDTNSQPVSNAPETEPAPAPTADDLTPPLAQIPRSALCPCGSGKRYKRCHGYNAPPVLHSKASQQPILRAS